MQGAVDAEAVPSTVNGYGANPTLVAGRYNGAHPQSKSYIVESEMDVLRMPTFSRIISSGRIVKIKFGCLSRLLPPKSHGGQLFSPVFGCLFLIKDVAN